MCVLHGLRRLVVHCAADAKVMAGIAGQAEAVTIHLDLRTRARKIMSD